jgi:hypothetical protein
MILSKSFIKHWLCGTIAFVLVACSSAPPPETKAAISSLKGLNSKLDVGINLGGYAEALRDTKVAVDRAIESDPKSKNNQVLEKVMNGHLAALKLWRCSLEEDYDAENECRTKIYETVIFPLYPEVQKKVEPEKWTSSSDNSYYYLVNHDEVLQILWQLSETELNLLDSK